jgi:HK97 family phage major capsid protein
MAEDRVRPGGPNFGGLLRDRRVNDAGHAPRMTDKEVAHYARDLHESLTGGAPVGIIRDRATGHRANAPEFHGAETVVSLGDLTRALTGTSHSAGGALVGTSVADDVELAMRAASVTVDLGARLITGLTQDSTLGRETSGTTLSWAHPAATITPSDPVFASVAITRHRLAGATSVAKQLDVQSQELSTRFLINSLLAAVGSALDLALLGGTGTMGQPAGIAANGSVLTKTFGGAATATILLDMIGQVGSNNASDASIGWALHPDVRERWMNIQR